MSAVIRSLLQDHANTSLLLQSMERQFEAFAAGDDIDLELLRSTLEYFAAFPDACHHPKEDLVLARLRQSAPDKVEGLSRLEDEHRELSQTTATLIDMVDRIVGEQEMPREVLVGEGRTYIENYRRHMTMEERALFAVAAETLQPEDWIEIGEAIYQKMDPVFGARFSESFDTLRTDIAAAE